MSASRTSDTTIPWSCCCSIQGRIGGDGERRPLGPEFAPEDDDPLDAEAPADETKFSLMLCRPGGSCQ